MNVLLMIGITTGVLSGIWGWIATTLGLISWAGFLGYAACFSSPISGLRGLCISILTCCTGIFWAEIIKTGSALSPQWHMLGYLLTGVVAFIMCIQSIYQWLAFIPGTFIGASAALATTESWQRVALSLLLGLVFAYAMKISGMWLMHLQQKRQQARSEHKEKPVTFSDLSRSEGS